MAAVINSLTAGASTSVGVWADAQARSIVLTTDNATASATGALARPADLALLWPSQARIAMVSATTGAGPSNQAALPAVSPGLRPVVDRVFADLDEGSLRDALATNLAAAGTG
jgi:hypothetical protein